MSRNDAVDSMEIGYIGVEQPPTGYAKLTYVIAAGLMCVGMIAAPYMPQLTILLGALVCGWTEVSGLCGSAHVSSMVAVRRIEGPKRWFAALLAYTLCGLATAAMIGAALSFLVGSITFGAGDTPQPVHAAVIVCLAILLIGRELRVFRFPLPQVYRQTERLWAQRFGFVTAAGMWGAHIGVCVATVITHGGVFVLVASMALFDPAFGATAMAVYWIGRTLPMWFGPILAFHRPDESICCDIHKAEHAYRHAASAGMVLMSLAVVVASTR